MGFSITEARPGDYDAFAKLFPELRVIEATPGLAYFRDAILPGAIFLRDGDDVAGYAWWRARGDRAHVVHVIVDPDRRKRGVGRALMQAVAERARAAGLTRWMLNVKPENVAARKLYASCGMTEAFESVSVKLPWASVDRLELETSAKARPLAIGEESIFERACNLPANEIASFRNFAGRLLFACEDASGSPAGVGAFDPKFPGASPFAVRDPKYARTLLTKMKEHALPEPVHLFVFAENDPKLADALTNAAGGEIAMRVLRMEGDVPGT